MIARLLLLLSAYSPLPLIVGIRDHNANQSWTLVGLGVLFALGLPIVIGAALRRGHPVQAKVASVADSTQEVSGYLATFILPLVALTAPTARDLAAFAAFGILLAAAYLQSGRLAVNPWLFFLRRRIYDVDIGNGRELVLAATPPAQDEVELFRLARGLYYSRPERHGR